MARTVYHVRNFSIGVKRKYRISADDGAGRPGSQLGYAEKELTVSDEIALYRDEERTERLATVRESDAGFLAALTGYSVVDVDDWFRLTVHTDSIDRTLLFALAITMEARQRG